MASNISGRATPAKHHRRRGANRALAARVRNQRSEAEESALIRRVQARDQAAFEVIYRRYRGQVHRQVKALVSNEEETADVVQEVFLTLYEKAKTFRGESTFATWLYRLTMNAALTRLRRRKRSKEVAWDEYLPRYQPDGHHLRPVVDWSRDVNQHLLTKEVHRILQRVLDQLPPKDKAVVVLSDLEGIPNREIGEALGLSVPAVKTRLHRARLFLRGQLAVSLGHSPY